MKRKFLILGSVYGFFSVAFGAFGTHQLKNILSPDMFSVFETGVRYQMYHSLAIVLIAVFVEQYPLLRYTGRLFGAGTMIFSGSLYVLSLTGIKFFGIVAPIGGLCLLAGWCMFFIAAFKMKTPGK